MPAMTSASARDVARAEDFEKDPAVVVTSAAGAGVYVVGALEGDGLNTLIGTLTGDGDDAAVANADIGDEAGRAGAVDDGAPLEQQIEHAGEPTDGAWFAGTRVGAAVGLAEPAVGG